MKTIGRDSIVIELSREELNLIRACANAASIRWTKKGKTDEGFEKMAELADELFSKIYRIQTEIEKREV